jgi:capsular polysaccharide biosynthesis protein
MTQLRRPIGRFGLVLALTLVGGFAAWVYDARTAPSYTARAYVMATGSSSDAMTYARVYAGIATTGPVLAEAAGLLGADSSGLDRVTASTATNAPVIQIAARSPSAARAVTVADAVARALAAYGSENRSDFHMSLAVLAAATTPTHPSSPSHARDLLTGTSAGLLIGALAALLTLRRPRPRSAPPAPDPARPTFDDPAEIAGHLGIWRAQYGERAVTSYRSAAAMTEPDEWVAAAEDSESTEGSESTEIVTADQDAATGEPADDQPPDSITEPGGQTADRDVAPAGEPAENVDEERAVTDDGSVHTGPIVGRASVPHEGDA